MNLLLNLKEKPVDSKIYCTMCTLFWGIFVPARYETLDLFSCPPPSATVATVFAPDIKAIYTRCVAWRTASIWWRIGPAQLWRSWMQMRRTGLRPRGSCAENNGRVLSKTSRGGWSNRDTGYGRLIHSFLNSITRMIMFQLGLFFGWKIMHRMRWALPILIKVSITCYIKKSLYLWSTGEKRERIITIIKEMNIKRHRNYVTRISTRLTSREAQ